MQDPSAETMESLAALESRLARLEAASQGVPGSGNLGSWRVLEDTRGAMPEK